MASTVGEIKIGLKFDSSDYKKSLGGVEKATNSSGSRIGRIFDTALTAAVSSFIVNGINKLASSLVDLGKQAINAYADFEQLSGGMQKIFDEVNYDQIAADANAAYETMNISANQYMESIAGVGAVFAQTMGDVEGYETAKQGMQALADYASGTGKSVDDLMSKYQAITRSTSSYLSIADQFAGLLPQTTDGFLKQAQASGLLADSYTKLSEVPVAEYQAALTSMLESGVKDMGLLGNTAAETANTISGSLNATKAAWSNVLASFGQGEEAVSQAIENLMTSVGNVVKNITPLISPIISGLTQLLNDIIGQLPGLLQTLLPPLIEGAVLLINGLVSALPGLLDALTASLPALVSGIISIISTLLQNIGPILKALTDMVIALALELTKPDTLNLILKAGIDLLMSLVKAIPQIITALAVALPNIIDNIINFLTDPETLNMLIKAAVELFTALTLAVPQILGSLVQAFAHLVGSLWIGIRKMFVSFAANFGDLISGIFKSAINSVLMFIENVINTPVNLINGFIGAINGAFGFIGVNLGYMQTISLPRLAEGGFASGASPALIGEAGREVVIPLDRNTDNWSGLLADTLINEMDEDPAPREVIINNYNTINSDLDVNLIAQKMGQEIRRATI